MAALGRIAARRCDGQVFGDSEIGKDFIALRHQHNAACGIGVRRLVFDPLSGEADAAGDDAGVIETDETRDRAERSSLAGAVVAEERDDGLRHHPQRDAMQRHRDAVIGDLERVDHQKRRGRRRLRHEAEPARRAEKAFFIRCQMPISPAGSSNRNKIITTPNAA